VEVSTKGGGIIFTATPISPPKDRKITLNKGTIFSAWSCPLFGGRAREILLYALLLKLFDYSVHLVISPKLLAFKAEIA
jgi:hypothetical protein